MKAIRKGVSPVVATLLLILIAVAAAVLLYTWVSGMSANVAGSKVTGKTLSLIQATWAGTYQINNGNDKPDTIAYDKGIVLIASFQAPAAAVGKQQAGYGQITIDNVNVLFNGRVICGYNLLAASADDRFHVGQTMGTRDVESVGNANTTTTTKRVAGVIMAGFSGTTVGTRDAADNDHDSPVPGIVLFATVDTPMEAANGTTVFAGGTYVEGKDTRGGNTYYFYPAKDAFATVVAGTYQVNYVATDYVETSFNPTGAKVVYDKWMSQYVNVAVDGQGNNYQADLFDLVTVSQGAFSVVAYCPNVNINTMNSVMLQLQFKDGSTWQTEIPLNVQ